MCVCVYVNVFVSAGSACVWRHNKYAVWPRGNTRAGQWDERTRHVPLQDELELEERSKATPVVVSNGHKSQSLFSPSSHS